jgi:peroxiredoxin Q/BCP
MRKFSSTLAALILTFSFATFSMGSCAFALTPGDKAPDFSAHNQDGKTVKLSDFAGKPLLLYFYPKDETPGCTTEACSFRDGFSKFKKFGAVVLGVSRQDEKSHRQFRKKYHLPFDLLVDTDGAVSKAYGVGLMAVIGLDRRQSVLIGPDGKVVKFYGDVDPSTHVDEVLEDISKLTAAH